MTKKVGLQRPCNAPSFLDLPATELGKFQRGNRAWFYRLVNQEECHWSMELVWNNVTRLLDECCSNVPPGSAQKLFGAERDFDVIGERLRANVPGLLGGARQRQHFYFQHAPLFNVLGGWLSGVTSIAYAWRPEGGLMLKTHAMLVGEGQRPFGQPYLFEQAARRAGVHLSGVCTGSFSQDVNIQEAAFKLPVFFLAMACFPSKLFAETLGVNLALCSYVDQLNTLLDGAGEPLFGKVQAARYRPLALASIEQFLAGAEPHESGRVAAGYACALNLVQQHEGCIVRDLTDHAGFGCESAMTALIEKLGPHGCGYHKRGALGGKPIDEWLNPESFCARSTIRALASSRYVIPGEPGRSALMSLITDPKGRMFGVFSASDVQVVRTWIASLSDERSEPRIDPAHKAARREFSDTPSETALVRARQRALSKYSRHSLRQLYPLFLHIDKAPDALAMARQFADRWLACHAARSRRGGAPFSPYTHEKLDEWLNAQHERQVDSYRPLTGAPEESRDDVVAEAMKLAPLTFIDGAWLRSVATPSSVTSPVGALLYRILLDELGKGEISQHHGNIYRELLVSMGVDVGVFTDESFATARHFDDANLQVPVFWLAISLFPRRYQAETLGLNLAMELSGVGGEYRRSGDVLRHYGFSSTFTDLHNTIDNVVTGHTAWAIEAIKQHLDDVAQRGGQREVDHHWRRIWVGYRALNPPKNSLMSALQDLAGRSFGRFSKEQVES